MITETATIGGREFYHHISEYGGKLRCIETDTLFDDVYIPTDTIYTYEELPNEAEISDSEALRIITGQ